MLALSERHLQQLYETSRSFVNAIQTHLLDLWTAHLKPRLGKRGGGYVSTAHQRLEHLERWQVVVLTAFVTLIFVQLLAALRDSLQSFQEKGELPHTLKLRTGEKQISMAMLEQAPFISAGIKQSIFDAGKRLPFIRGIVQHKQEQIRVGHWSYRASQKSYGFKMCLLGCLCFHCCKSSRQVKALNFKAPGVAILSLDDGLPHMLASGTGEIEGISGV